MLALDEGETDQDEDHYGFNEHILQREKICTDEDHGTPWDGFKSRELYRT